MNRNRTLQISQLCWIQIAKQTLSVFVLAALCLYLTACTSAPTLGPLGIFEEQVDVGEVGIAGGSVYNPETREYKMLGGGENIWYHSDAFQFLYKQVSGDVEISAEVELSPEGHEHRKAGLMIRQSLEHNAQYVDALVHGNGLAAMQFRDIHDGPTSEQQSTVAAPMALKLIRKGDEFSFELSEDGTTFVSGGSLTLKLEDPVYVGLVVCSHDDTVTETAVFRNVQMKAGDSAKKK